MTFNVNWKSLILSAVDRLEKLIPTYRRDLELNPGSLRWKRACYRSAIVAYHLGVTIFSHLYQRSTHTQTSSLHTSFHAFIWLLMCCAYIEWKLTTKMLSDARRTNESDASPPISSIQPQMSAIVDIDEFFHFFPKSTFFSETQHPKKVWNRSDNYGGDRQVYIINGPVNLIKTVDLTCTAESRGNAFLTCQWT